MPWATRGVPTIRPSLEPRRLRPSGCQSNAAVRRARQPRVGAGACVVSAGWALLEPCSAQLLGKANLSSPRAFGSRLLAEVSRTRSSTRGGVSPGVRVSQPHTAAPPDGTPGRRIRDHRFSNGISRRPLATQWHYGGCKCVAAAVASSASGEIGQRSERPAVLNVRCRTALWRLLAELQRQKQARRLSRRIRRNSAARLFRGCFMCEAMLPALCAALCAHR